MKHFVCYFAMLSVSRLYSIEEKDDNKYERVSKEN
jgi:hypothetical protein